MIVGKAFHACYLFHLAWMRPFGISAQAFWTGSFFAGVDCEAFEADVWHLVNTFCHAFVYWNLLFLYIVCVVCVSFSTSPFFLLKTFKRCLEPFVFDNRLLDSAGCEFKFSLATVDSIIEIDEYVCDSIFAELYRVNMPIYDLECPNCGEITDIWAKIEEMAKECPFCGAKTRRLMSPTRIICDLEPYFDENLADNQDKEGKWVQSRQHRCQLMKEQGLIILKLMEQEYLWKRILLLVVFL